MCKHASLLAKTQNYDYKQMSKLQAKEEKVHSTASNQQIISTTSTDQNIARPTQCSTWSRSVPAKQGQFSHFFSF